MVYPRILQWEVIALRWTMLLSAESMTMHQLEVSQEPVQRQQSMSSLVRILVMIWLVSWRSQMELFILMKMLWFRRQGQWVYQHLYYAQEQTQEQSWTENLPWRSVILFMQPVMKERTRRRLEHGEPWSKRVGISRSLHSQAVYMLDLMKPANRQAPLKVRSRWQFMRMTAKIHVW